MFEFSAMNNIFELKNIRNKKIQINLNLSLNLSFSEKNNASIRPS